MKFGISTKLKMESDFCINDVKHSNFVYSFVYISDFKLAAKTKIKKKLKGYVQNWMKQLEAIAILFYRQIA